MHLCLNGVAAGLPSRVERVCTFYTVISISRSESPCWSGRYAFPEFFPIFVVFLNVLLNILDNAPILKRLGHLGAWFLRGHLQVSGWHASAGGFSWLVRGGVLLAACAVSRGCGTGGGSLRSRAASGRACAHRTQPGPPGGCRVSKHTWAVSSGAKAAASGSRGCTASWDRRVEGSRRISRSPTPRTPTVRRPSCVLASCRGF